MNEKDIKEDFLAWTGGFSPESEGQISDYLRTSYPAEDPDSNHDEARRILESWKDSEIPHYLSSSGQKFLAISPTADKTSGTIGEEPKAGEKFGCTDGYEESPGKSYQLSRILDLLRLAQEIGLKQEVWLAIPKHVRFELNWCHWTYQPRSRWFSSSDGES